MSFFSLVSMLVALAAVSSYVNYRYIKLPTTVGVMLVALIASLSLVLIGPYAGGFREQAAALFRRSTSTRSSCMACLRSCCSPERYT